MGEEGRPELYKAYPVANRLTYNGVTAAHYVLGGLGILIGYGYAPWATVVALAYVVIAYAQMYVIMPLVVCPNCVYYRMGDAVCVSGLNRLSRRIAREGRLEDFPKRAGGLSHNKLYMGSFIVPIVIVAPALLLNFSVLLLAIFLAVLGLLLLRFFVIFPKVACVHCMAKHRCPNAKAMGLV
jgi:hypothetical protein